MSTAAEEIARVVRSGVRLWREDERLRLRSPAPARLQEARERLAAHKDEALAILRPGVQYAPLSSVQERLWFLARADVGGAEAYNMPVALAFEGRLDFPRLAGAIERVVARHEPLRTRVVVLAGLALAAIDDIGPGAELVEAAAVDLEAVLAREAWAPFDLMADHPFRARLLRGAEGDVLLLQLHHAAADGWSIGLLLAELAQAYAGADEAEPVTPFGDLICARKTREPGELSDLADAAARDLAGYPVRLNLPRARPHPAEPSYRGGGVETRLSPEVSRALLALAAEAGVSLFATALTALGLWCHRVGGQDRLLIGAALAARSEAGAAGAIGPFANLLPLPCDFRGAPSFRQALGRARAVVQQAMAFEALPFEALVERLAPLPEPGVPPLVQVTVGYEPDSPAGLVLGGVEGRRRSLDQAAAKFDFSMEARLDGETLVLSFGYALDLFDDAMARRMTASLAALLGAAVASPDVPVDELPATAELEACAAAARVSAPQAGAPGWRSLPRGDVQAPLTPEQAVIAAAIEAVLGVSDVGPDDNFFAVGGHSLRAVQLVERLRERHSLDLPLKAVLLGRTVAELASVATLATEASPVSGTCTAIEDMDDAALDAMLLALEAAAVDAV